MDINGCDLDKDIIGNSKMYSPENCVFVKPYQNHQKINNRGNTLYFFKNRDTGEIKKDTNVSNLSRRLGFHRSSLSKVILGNRSHISGWELYKKEEIIYVC